MRTREKKKKILWFKLNWIWALLIFISLGQQDPDFKKPHTISPDPDIPTDKMKVNYKDRDLPLILQPKEKAWSGGRGSQSHFHPRRHQSIPHFFSTCTITTKRLQADMLFSLSSNDTLSDKITTPKLKCFLEQGLETGSPTRLPPAHALTRSCSRKADLLYKCSAPRKRVRPKKSFDQGTREP